MLLKTGNRMIEFNCHFCGRSMKVPAKAAGRKGTCKKCGETVRVPSETAVIEPLIVNEKSGSLIYDEKPTRKQFRLPPWTINTLLAGLGLVALGGISFYFFSAGDSTVSINTKRSADLPSKKIPPTEILEKEDADAASQKLLAALQESFTITIDTVHAKPSSNQFLQSQLITAIADTKALFNEFLSHDYQFQNWTILALDVEQSDDGEIVVKSILKVIKGKDENLLGVLNAKFIVENQACLEKVKKLNTPCVVKVSGQYNGKRDKEGEVLNFYTLYFDLFDIEE